MLTHVGASPSGAMSSSRSTTKHYYSTGTHLVDPPAGVRPVRVSTANDMVHVLVQTPHSVDSEQEDRWSLPHLWLRDMCPCSLCQSPSSGQKTFATCDLDAEINPSHVQMEEDGSLHVTWSDGHASVYPFDYYASRYSLSLRIPRQSIPDRILWDSKTFQQGLESRNVAYSDWMEGGPAFSQAFQNLLSYGLIVVKNVPASDASVQNVGERIGPIMDTFYGLTWDVVSKPDAENVAYTSEFLPLHQDLMYHQPIPKIQLLHCLKNECAGGESLFSDGVLACWAMHLSELDPPSFDVLATERIPYWYTKNGNDRYRAHPVVQMTRKPHAIPRSIHWSPPFQAPLSLEPTSSVLGGGPLQSKARLRDKPTVSVWMQAVRTFRDWIEKSSNMWQYKMEPGDCVIFDNQRVLHGRTQFEASKEGGGQRHLRGAYLDESAYEMARSRYDVSSKGENRLKFIARSESLQARKITGLAQDNN